MSNHNNVLKENKYKASVITIISLLIMIFIFSLPAFRNGAYKGHDFIFHLGRINAIADELKQGHFLVRYESNAWYGYGYVTSTMYPNIFLYIPAVLHILGLPLYRAYNIYVLLVNILSVCLAYYSFKRIFKEDKWGLLATLLYIFSAYHFSNVYRRAAVGEYTAMAFVPLLVYGFYKLYYEKSDEEILIKILPIVISVFGILESHVLTTELMAMVIFVFVILNIKKTIRLIKELIISLCLIIVTNLFFLYPFIDTYIHEKMYINTMINEDLPGSGLYISQLFRLFSEGRGYDFLWTSEAEEYLALGLAMLICIALTVVCLVVYPRHISDENDQVKFKMIIQVFVIGIVAVVLSTIYFPWSIFVGDSPIDKLMSAVQFPWRYLLVQTICFTITGVFSIKKLIAILFQDDVNKVRAQFRTIIGIVSVFIVIAFLQTGIFFRYLSFATETVRDEVVTTGWPEYVDYLYLLEGTDKKAIVNEQNVSFEENNVVLPTFAYRNIRIENESGDEISYSKGDNNRVVINKNDYSEDLKVVYSIPILWRVSDAISLVSIIVICIFIIAEKRKGVNH